MKKFIKTISLTLLTSALTLPLFTNVEAEEKNEFEGEKVTVGIVPGSAEDVWQVVVDQAKEEGIEVELQFFTDYNQPNEALQNGSIDLNAFQHIAFLDNWNESNDGSLVPIGFTFVSPMGTYSEKIKSLDELPEGGTVAIPNDPTNGGRALLALELAGVLEIDDEAGILVTPEDITENPKNIKIEELDAAQLAATLPDVDAAIINTNFANDAGLSLKDAIFVDADYPEKLSEKYKNSIVAREEDKENPLYLKIVELYQTDAVAQAIYDTTNGGDKPVWENAPVIGEQTEDETTQETTVAE
ncbi:MetQ/NlpA family ABC transporter substrate-binding protein [Globicatella sanguinis]|uniref:MetQ/NlpA family ABC transporter substrate-binding protein n=1 Tax=Globicatella sanguinis TaxID=13076 RepID=UPI000C7B635B|nr:MetQ/NlpA family ABC transporter substrate-binding protein [Globicatella sanguinis]MDK7630940.1 MetQ/NlpA family ABC transporter substrate-binding protein [Globicatella sanguinis]WIK65602.1 MetQ/NlpA family ABC transporter substrate-binding protein [Globicatella sanguinis]WKT55007.1 MetQ/NlpA family ABC transporter substrate-binding protein [Globicatella sanguinis]